jgi:hypothetical protein
MRASATEVLYPLQVAEIANYEALVVESRCSSASSRDMAFVS